MRVLNDKEIEKRRKKKQINNILIGSENKKLIIFLALSYCAQLYGYALKQ